MLKRFSYHRINKVNYYYIIVNIGLSVFAFLRSFVFMRVLDLKELGIISLVQTIFMLIGMLQIGLLNGGYRIVSLGKTCEIEKTNNTIFSYSGLLLLVGILFCFVFSHLQLIKDLSFVLLIISVFFGVLTLLSNWYLNMLIGEQKLEEVNISNVASYLFSALMLPLAFLFGFWGAMSVIMIQPFVFVGLGFLRNKELRPTGIYFDKEYIRYILSFGFIPFLGGIFTMLYLQVERWSIDGFLGVEALGCFYLVFLYVSLFQLVPNSLNSIFFPKGVKSYSEKQYDAFRRVIKYYYLSIIAYNVLIILGTMFFLEPVVALLFPKHLVGVSFVYIILPGLVLLSLVDPIGLILNSTVILRPMLIVSLLNFAFCVIALFIINSLGNFTLQNVAILRTVSGIFVFVAYILVFIIIKRKIYK